MNRYHTNLASLTDRYPLFRKEIVERFTPGGLEILSASNGEPTARARGRFIHSQRAPSIEAAKTVASRAPDRAAACLCFGFGLGYYVRAAYELLPDTPIIAIEPDPGRFLKALEAIDFTGIILDQRVNLLAGATPAEVFGVISDLPPGPIHLVAPQSLVQLDPAYFKTIRDGIADITSRRDINRNTLARFGERWIRNLMLNTGIVSTAAGVSTLHNRFIGIPALVLAAGPSLDRILPRLNELADRALVIAVDTSLKACRSAGVVPDIVVVVDPQYWNTRHLDWCDTSQTVLVSESSTHPSIFRRSYQDILLCGSLFPLGRYLERYTGVFGTLGAGGSVATTAWDLARYSGCSPVYIAGLDLGFPECRTHYLGSTFEERSHLIAHRTSPAEHHSFLALHDAGPFRVRSNDGTTLLTDKRLIVYRGWFEAQLEMDRDVDARTFSHRGAYIERMRAVELTDLLERTSLRAIICERLAASVRPGNGPGSRPTVNTAESPLLQGLTTLLEELGELSYLARHARSLALRTRDLPYPGLLDAQNSIDERIRSSAGKEIIGFLMQDVIESIATDTRGSGVDRSIELYDAIDESCRFHLAQIRRGLLEQSRFSENAV